MNANQIARLMLVTTQSFLRQEIPHAEYVDLVQSLAAQAREAGIQDAAATAYNQMCLDWHARNEAV
jgi:hypothetical protein